MANINNFADFVAAISRHDSRMALIDDASGQVLTYHDLVELAGVVAGQLAARNVRPGDRIILYKLRTIDWVPCFLGAQLAGIVVVPIDSRLSEAMVGAVMADTTPRFVVTDEQIIADAEQIAASELLAAGSQPSAHRAVGSDLAEVLYTSGTWSKPKGVTLSQANLMANMLATYDRFAPKAGDVALSILPLAHAYEQMAGLLVPLYAGVTLVYLSEISSGALTAALKKHHVTIMVIVPRVLELLKRSILQQIPRAGRLAFERLAIRSNRLPQPLQRRLFATVHRQLGPNLLTLIVGGAPYSLDLDRFFRGLGYRTVIGYGLSEASPIVSTCVTPRGRTRGSVGALLDNVQVKINDDGEVLVKGPSVFYGYWPHRRQEEWFNTGDLGYMNSSDDLVLTGRSKNLIVYPNGDKLFLEDVEYLADTLENIEESCVVYSPDTFTGVFDVLVKSPAGFDEQEVKMALLANLPATVRIGRVINIHPAAIPRTHTLKLDRRQVWKQFGAKS